VPAVDGKFTAPAASEIPAASETVSETLASDSTVVGSGSCNNLELVPAEDSESESIFFRV